MERKQVSERMGWIVYSVMNFFWKFDVFFGLQQILAFVVCRMVRNGLTKLAFLWVLDNLQHMPFIWNGSKDFHGALPPKNKWRFAKPFRSSMYCVQFYFGRAKQTMKFYGAKKTSVALGLPRNMYDEQRQSNFSDGNFGFRIIS